VSTAQDLRRLVIEYRVILISKYGNVMKNLIDLVELSIHSQRKSKV